MIPEEFLKSFKDIQRAIVNYSRIKKSIEEVDSLILPSIASTPDPDLALNNLERLLSSPTPCSIKPFLEEDNLNCLLKFLGSSQSLANYLINNPDLLYWLFSETTPPPSSSLLQGEGKSGGALFRSYDFNQLLSEACDEYSGIRSFDVVCKFLRMFKKRHLVRIAIRDINALADLMLTMQDLSSLASASLEMAYKFCQRELEEEFGKPLIIKGDGTQEECEFTILGLGKLGGEELNFSSDIDIMFIFTSSRGETTGIIKGGIRKNRLPLIQFYLKLCEKICQAIGRVTQDGFVFRVDLRLRPEGINGPMANSLEAAETYYQYWGQSWERAALIKARPAAGSIFLGERFLKSLEPFIYRKYLDFSAIDEIRQLKKRINLSESRCKDAERDIKLGPGGIREIEFFIQTMQLIYGGKDPNLRGKNSLQALEALYQGKYIDQRTFSGLKEAYIFLRTVEHRIQIINEQQIHSLPRNQGEIEKLALRTGFDEASPRQLFIQTLENHRAMVKDVYVKLFYQPSDSTTETPPELVQLLEEGLEEREIYDRLGQLGFEEPIRAYKNLKLVKEGPPHSLLLPKGRRLLERIYPLLIKEITSSPDSDMALNNMERFINRVGARTTFLSLLAENPYTLKLLVKLFGTSHFLSQFFIEHPELLDSLIRRDSINIYRKKVQMDEELTKILDYQRTYEDLLDSLRRYKNSEVLNIGIHDIYGELEIQEVFERLSDLAELCLEKAYLISKEQLSIRYGIPSHKNPAGERQETDFVILGLGKLGGREMSYTSDLDIIFIYSNAGETIGGITITNQEYFAKLAQRIISCLSLYTREGFAYKIDTRLRPSGNAGPLVTSFPSFERYHRESSQIWERQALLKGRIVVGSRELGEKVLSVIRDFLFRNYDGWPLAPEINRLRDRMEKEIAKETKEKYNIKFGKGGIVDVEFIIQYLQLKYGWKRDLWEANTLKALSKIWENKLITKEECEILHRGYMFLRRMENRLLIDRDAGEVISGRVEKLARRMGYTILEDMGQRLLEDYKYYTEGIRKVYNRYLA